MRSTIYIVDDAAEYRLLLEKAFARYLPQYDVQFFASGDALCDAVAAGSLPRPPDLLLLDLRMPGRDGVAMLQFIRQPGQWPFVPVVVLSAMSQQTDVDACYEVGASFVVQKPTSFTLLVTLLESLCHYWLHLNRRPPVRPA